jgi:hypothetical protein
VYAMIAPKMTQNISSDLPLCFHKDRTMSRGKLVGEFRRRGIEANQEVVTPVPNAFCMALTSMICAYGACKRSRQRKTVRRHAHPYSEAALEVSHTLGRAHNVRAVIVGASRTQLLQGAPKTSAFRPPRGPPAGEMPKRRSPSQPMRGPTWPRRRR